MEIVFKLERGLMNSICIEKTRILKLALPYGFEIDKIIIGIPVTDEEAAYVKLMNVGDSVLPSASFGNACRKNAEGYHYADRTKPKAERYVCTNWFHPYGNEDADEVPVDIYRKCYPRVFVPPTEIEFVLYQNSEKQKFIVAEMQAEPNDNLVKVAVNMFLEVYGKCYVYSDQPVVAERIKTTRRNWVILPPGKRPSEHLSDIIRTNGGGGSSRFELKRLETVEEYAFSEQVAGTNGFSGYYAYVHKSCCVFESATYGNATYIIPYENWEVLSQKTKKELFDSGHVLKKIVHMKTWEDEFRRFMAEMKIDSRKEKKC